MNGAPFTLLVVDGGLPESAAGNRFRLRQAASAQVETWLREAPVDAVLLWAPRATQDLHKQIRRWKSLRPKAQFFVLLDQTPSTRALVGLMHAGCQDVLERPSADLAALLDSIEERLSFVRIRGLERLESRHGIHYAGLVGESPEMVKLYAEIEHAARLSCPVLLFGETGTGKGLVAHAIHALSGRSDKPFVTVDCGCLAPTLIESELYGVARGAFTGATADRAGLVEAAQEGTLFLDEVAELPLGMQPKLLRLLEEGEVRRLGSPRSAQVDVRVISATSRELETLIGLQQFRLDLYYRLNVLTIELAPLRQKPQDVPLLARHFASRHLCGGEPVTLSGAVLEALAAYPWPGNVRELKNTVEAAIARAGSSTIQPEHLPRPLGRPAALGDAASEPVNLRQLERNAIRRALDLAHQDKARAARLLGIGKTTLYRKLKQLEGAPGSPGPYLMWPRRRTYSGLICFPSPRPRSAAFCL